MTASVNTFGSVDGASLTLYKGYPRARRTGPLWEVEYRYWCKQAKALELTPDDGTACPLMGDLKLREASIDPNGTTGMCDVTLTYKADEATVGIGPHADGDVTQEASLSQEEIAIDDTRLVSGSILSQAEVDALKAAGVQSVPVGSVEYTRTEYSDDFTWSEANVIAAAGTVQAPTGMTSPTSGKWMAIGARIRQTNEGLTEVSTTWKYNKAGWRA